MPKMKTHSGCKKRFKISSTGKVKRAKAYRRHHAWAKTPKQTRSLRKGAYFTGTEALNMARLLPYS
jgi:large subunit ribosomal protein L35